MDKIKKQFQKIPSISGVYFFRDARGRIIYIGKAVNLKARVKSYFIKNSLYGIKASMLPEIAKIDYKTTDTEIDALILESRLIKKYRPKYNVILKDDKNYFYVVITADEFPKVYITHQISKFYFLNSKFYPLGPYTDGQALKTVMRYLRKIFPYCTCKNQHKIPCLKLHLGLCLGICCTKQKDDLQSVVILRQLQMAEESSGSLASLRMTYHNNIKSIVDILSGRKKTIFKKMEREMMTAAKRENFEKAAFLRDKISALNNIFQHKISNYRGSTSPVAVKDEISRIFGIKINRIEFYDVSNISGQLATASMAVFDGERINRSEYRKFKINPHTNSIGVGVKSVFGADDPAMIREVLTRRLDHKEWQMPDLIIVDGGITQLGIAQKVLKGNGIKIKCASLAKNPDRLFVNSLKQIPLKNLSQDSSLFLRQLRDEAHRFAISYHRKLRSRKLANDFKIE